MKSERHLKTRNELMLTWVEKRCLTGSQYNEKLTRIRSDMLAFFRIRDPQEFTLSLTDVKQWLGDNGFIRFMRHNAVWYQGIAVRKVL